MAKSAGTTVFRACTMHFCMAEPCHQAPQKCTLMPRVERSGKR